MQNITSEQELKQLLEDGKIGQGDYEQLREAMHAKDRVVETAGRAKPRKSCKKTKALAILNTVAFICFLAALIAAIFSNKPSIIAINIVCIVLAGASALRYWINYWTSEEMCG